MEYRRKVITVAAFFALGFMGMTMAIMGASLPAMRVFFNMSLEQAGALTVFYQMGYALNNFIGGLLSDMARRERVIIAGCGLLGFGSMFFAVWNGLGLACFLILVMGLGSGLILTGSNALLVGIYSTRKASIMNIHHVFFGLGSLIGPLIMAQLLKYEGFWRYGYHGLGVAVVLVIFLFLAAGSTPKVKRSGTALTKNLGAVLRNKAFIHLVTINTMVVGTQFGLMFLSVTYLHEGKDISVIDAGYVLSLSCLGLIVGRLACSWLTIRHFASHVVLILLALLTASLAVAVVGDGNIAAAGIVASGLACSGVFPSLLGLGGILCQEAAGTALGIMSTMNGLGGALFCWLITLVSQRINLQAGFMVLICASLCALLFHFYNMRAFSRAEMLAKGYMEMRS